MTINVPLVNNTPGSTLDIYLVHGWKIDPNNETKWQPFIQSLKKRKINGHFLALPGLSAPLAEVWTLENYVDWLTEKLKNHRRIIVLGHSFGGQLAIRYTTLHPDQVRALVLLDSSGIIDHRWPAQLKRNVFKFVAKVGKMLTHAQTLKTFLYRLAREMDYYEAPPNLQKTMANVLKEEIVADLDRIACPTNIIWGEHDATTPVRNAHLLHARIQKSELHFIKEARHSPHFTHPDQVTQVLVNFLSKHQLIP